jgi:hypothetical protein
MLQAGNILAQSSFSFSGSNDISGKSFNTIGSFETTPSNYSVTKDWAFSLITGGEFSDYFNSSLYTIALSKRLSPHNFTLRYTPGYQKEFFFNSGESIIINDSTSNSLQASFNYRELFGLGYSIDLTEELSAGFTMRYFTQEFNKETLTPVFSDSVYLLRENVNENISFWKTDLGIDYFLFKDLLISLASVNLLNFGSSVSESEFEKYKLKTEKNVLLGLNYFPASHLNLSAYYESSGSFQTGLSTGFSFLGGNLNFSATVFHDKYQEPFIAGIIPSISFSINNFGIKILGVKYFSNRNTSGSYSFFDREGINNIINNRYSLDKAVMNFTFALNTQREKYLEFIDVEIIEEIFPTLSESYFNKPFAVGKVVNIGNKQVTVKPFSKIEGLNESEITSPYVSANPGDTVRIAFYTLIPENYKGTKTEISYADFFIYSINDEPDDRIQKAVLVNSSNAWDGKVSNLKFFIKKGFEFSIGYSKNILSMHKSVLDTTKNLLLPFVKTNILFDHFVKELVYTADPRASAEYVQFPEETVKLKGGDCDDLSVALSAILESAGIQTALVDYKADGEPRHVNLLVNTGLAPEYAGFLTNNDTKYSLRKNEFQKDEVWIAIETTSLTDFNTAWEIGSQKFNNEALINMGLSNGKVEIIDVY